MTVPLYGDIPLEKKYAVAGLCLYFSNWAIEKWPRIYAGRARDIVSNVMQLVASINYFLETFKSGS